MLYNGYGGYSSNPYLNGANRYYPQYQQPIQPQYMAQQPMAQQPQQVQQQMPAQQPVQQSFDMPFSDIRYLTADEIKAFIVMPNSKVMLIDKGNNLAYIKSADSMGQSTTKIYRFSDYVEEPKAEVKPAQPEIDTSMFIKTDDFESVTGKLTKKMEQLEEKLKALLKIEGGKE